MSELVSSAPLDAEERAAIAAFIKHLRDTNAGDGPANAGDYLRLIQSDLHFRATQIRNMGIAPPIARALMKAAFERFLIADAAGDKDRTGERLWSIRIGDREVAERHGNPELGRLRAGSRAEAEKRASADESIVIALGHYGLPRGVGYWAIEIKEPATP